MRRPREPLQVRLAGELADLLAAISHDVVGSTGGLRVLSELLAEDVAAGDAEESAAVLVRGVRTLDDRVGALRAMHRLAEESPAEVDLRHVAREAAGDAGVPHDRVEGPATLACVRSDALRAAIAAILVNAQTHGEGVRALVLQADDEWMWVHVGDRGAGIAAARRAAVLRPFTTYREGGDGNGLALARRVAHLHEGALEIDDDGVWLGLPRA